MNKTFIDEKKLIGKSIDELGLPERERRRALAALSKADALVSAFFAAWRLLQRRPGRAIARPNLKTQ